MEADKYRNIQLDVLRSLMRPFVRFCIRHSHSIQDFTMIAKGVFLTVAEEEIRKSTKKVNVSRLAVMTGMYRDEVTKLYREKVPQPSEPMSILSRVLGQWRQDKRFTTKSGAPRVLTYKGDESEFRDLVETVSKNINHGTVLFELKRLGFAEETPKGLKLLKQLFGFEDDPRTGFELLARDVETMMDAVEENLLAQKDFSNLHIRTEYDNISVKELKTIRKWFIDEGKAFHRKARDFLSKFDRDINPDSKDNSAGTRVVLGSFSWTPSSNQKPKES